MLRASGLWHPTLTALTSSQKIGIHQHILGTAVPKNPKAALSLVQSSPRTHPPSSCLCSPGMGPASISPLLPMCTWLCFAEPIQVVQTNALLTPKSYVLAYQQAQTVRNLLAVQETWVQSLGREDPLEKGMATHSSVLA